MTLSLCVSISVTYLYVMTVSLSHDFVTLCPYMSRVSVSHLSVSRLCLLCHIMSLPVMSLCITSLCVTAVSLMSCYVFLCHVSLCIDCVSLCHEICAGAHISFRSGTNHTQFCVQSAYAHSMGLASIAPISMCIAPDLVPNGTFIHTY